jgi:histidinol-phosphatase
VTTHDLELAHRLADAGDAITLPAFQAAGMRVSTKTDGSVVTQADMAAETAMRRILADEVPSDAIVGEEHGATGGGDRRWLIDPIDGTSSFVAGFPEWATMVALESEGAIEVAVISCPALDRRWHASRGGGTWGVPIARQSGEPMPLAVSRVALSEMARVAAWPPAHRQKPESAGIVEGFVERAIRSGATVKGRDTKPTRDTGFPNAGVLVAAGAIDGFLLCGGGPWDIAPLVLLVEEAGGTFSDLDGGRRLDTGGALFSNGALHHTLLGWADQG